MHPYARASLRRRGFGRGPARAAECDTVGGSHVEASFAPAESDLAALVERLRGRAPLPALFPPRPFVPWDADIQRALTVDPAPPWPGGPALRAGLLLWNDALDASHSLSQGIQSPTGAYWHGIMHRREGDLDNAGYWFRRVDAHPVFEEVQAAAVRIAAEAEAGGNRWAGERRGDLQRAGRWDPFRFIDWCGATRGTAGPHPVLERIQVAEIELLLRHAYARGGG